MNYFRIFRIAGEALDDCAVLVHRSHWTDMTNDETTEWRLLRRRAGEMRIIANGEYRASDLWMSPSGTVYLIANRGGQGGLHRGTNVQGAFQWERLSELDTNNGTEPEGVWGLADDCVFAWGGGPFNDQDEKEDKNREERLRHPGLTWFFNGRSWKCVPSPGRIKAVHGAGPDSIFAVGGNGLVAHWDGSGWIDMARPVHVPLDFLHVVDANEAYAMTGGGLLLEGSQYGWHELANAGFIVHGMSKWDGRLIIATTFEGMLTLEKNRVVPFKSHLVTMAIHAGRTLMWVMPSGILETTDFSSFDKLEDADIGALVDAEYFPD